MEGEGSFRKGAGDEDLSGMKIKWLDFECGPSRNSSCGKKYEKFTPLQNVIKVGEHFGKVFIGKIRERVD